jgi:hypothetical protein
MPVLHQSARIENSPNAHGSIFTRRSSCIKEPLSHNNTVYMLETSYASVALS